MMAKKSRGFSLTRTLRVRLASLSPRKWWASTDSHYESLSPASPEAIDRSAYERLEPANDVLGERSEEAAKAVTLGGGETAPPAPLPPPMSTLTALFSSPTTVFTRLRQACGNLVDGARLSSLHVSELFVGNQMLMHVTATPIAGRRRLEAMPSKGFVAEDAVQIVAPERNQNSERER